MNVRRLFRTGIDSEMVVLALGVLLSILQFVFNRSLWFDTARIAINVADRSFIGLLHPLDLMQSAPVGFLWAVKLGWILSGHRDWGMLLIPCISHIASLILFFRILRTVVPDRSARTFAISVFATSIGPLFFSSDLKQYSTDMAITCLLMHLALREWKSFGKKILALSLAGTVVVSFSNASCFLLAGIVAFLLAEWRAERRSGVDFTCIVGAGILFGGTFLLYCILFSAPELKIAMQEYWSHDDHGFLFRQHGFRNCFLVLLKQSFGALLVHYGSLPVVALILALLPFGIVGCIVGHEKKLLVLTILPILAHSAASAARQYPFAPRMLLYELPLSLLLAAKGGEFLRKSRPRLALAAFVTGSFTSLGVLCCSFPLRFHEVKEAALALDAAVDNTDKVVIVGSLRYAWQFYAEHTDRLPARMRDLAVFSRDDGTSIVFSAGKGPNDGNLDPLLTGRAWLVLPVRRTLNAIPDVLVNAPVYALFKKMAKTSDVIGGHDPTRIPILDLLSRHCGAIVVDRISAVGVEAFLVSFPNQQGEAPREEEQTK